MQATYGKVVKTTSSNVARRVCGRGGMQESAYVAEATKNEQWQKFTRSNHTTARYVLSKKSRRGRRLSDGV